MNEMENEPEFAIPESFLQKLYEFSGGADKYKGIVLAVSSENGYPMIYSKFESPIIQMGLISALKDFLEKDETEEEE